MATYTVRMVDHAGWTPAQQTGLQAAVKKKFDEAFAGTQDSVDVSWVAPTANDNYVVHFVSDIGHSFLKEKWPHAVINPRAGGHTHTGNNVTGTEVYRSRDGDVFRFSSYAATVFHESMHNLFPYQSSDFVHQQDGGGEAAGLAAAEYSFHTPMTDHNKQLVRRGFSSKNAQYF